MILDNEKQRKILLEMLAAIQIPGTAIDDVYELKQAIKGASLPKDDHPREE